MNTDNKRINVKVITRAKKTEVIGYTGEVLRVKVSEPAVNGKANKACIELLAGYFNVKKSEIFILKGEKSNKKVICIKKN